MNDLAVGANQYIMNNPAINSKGNLGLTPDDGLKNNALGSGICDDFRMSNNENDIVKTLIKEYQDITPEDFNTYEEYQNAKEIAYQRLMNAVNNVNDNSNTRNTNNTSNFATGLRAIGQFFKDAGDNILGFIERHFM